MPVPTPEAQVGFLLNVQRLLEDGHFVATYKYALLLALADIAVERGDDSGLPLSIPTSAIAGKFITYYWRQAVPYTSTGLVHGVTLRQNTGRTAAILSKVAEARANFGGLLTDVERDRGRWKRLVRDIERVVRVMPLWKLQRIGNEIVDFLYQQEGHGESIELRAGVAFCLRRFHSLITELVRSAWLQYIRRNNIAELGATSDLAEFLFGSERANLGDVRPVLEDIQHRRCFYCDGELHSGLADVDHFIAWARYPVDLGHNFVLAHGKCNSAKGSMLASEEHLARWLERNRTLGNVLAAGFNSRGIIHDVAASTQVAHWAYAQAFHSGGVTWQRAKTFVHMRPDWERIFVR